MVLFRQRDRAAEVLLADDARRLRAIFEGSGLGPDEVAVHVDALGDPLTMRSALSWYAALDMAALAGVEEVRVPTTLVRTDADIASGPVAVQLCRQLVRAPYRLEVLAGVSHWVPDERPDAVVEAILHPPTGPPTDAAPASRAGFP